MRINEKYPYEKLIDLANRGILAWIDVHFAASLLRHTQNKSEEAAVFLAVQIAISRLGHLALTVDSLKITPDLECLALEKSDREMLECLVRKGMRDLPMELLETMRMEENYEGIPSKPMCMVADKDRHFFYLQRNWVFETRFIYHLERLRRSVLEETRHASRSKKELNDLQKEAVVKALTHSVSIISGGPGTGKTYTAAHIVETYLASLEPGERAHSHIVLAAPTGKAAAHLEAGIYKQLENHQNIKSGTLHSLLGIRCSMDFSKEEGYLPADLLIVDECSMIDVRLFSYLLSALKEGTRLVLMGDADQLPSIEAGSVFADLIQAGSEGYELPCTHLQKCMRSDQREILELSQAINEKRVEDVIEKISDGLSLESGFEKGDSEEVYKTIWMQIKNHFPPPSREEPDSGTLLREFDRFRILSCVRGGPLGVDALNKRIAQSYSTEACKGMWTSSPILIIRNDYSSGLYNGDVGALVRYLGRGGLREKEEYAIFWDKQGGVRKFPVGALPAYENAYCLSVHKSQGSEYETILLLVPPGSEVFGKEVLYTAVTRARKHLRIHGNEDSIRKAVGTTCRKHSGIVKRLMQEKALGDKACLNDRPLFLAF